MSDVFSVTAFGAMPLCPDMLIGGGILLGFKITGELITVEGSASEGEIFVSVPERLKGACDSGSTAYVLCSGTLPQELLDIYSVRVGALAYSPESADIFFKLVASAEDERPDTPLLFHKAVYEISRALKHPSHGRVDTVELIRGYLDAHARERVTQEMLSSAFFLSRSQIFRLFKERYGVSPMQYHARKKADIAYEMLLSTEMRVSDIAEALGFADAKHMSTVFKKYKGMLPRDCRRAARGAERPIK